MKPRIADMTDVRALAVMYDAAIIDVAAAFANQHVAQH